MGNKIDFKKSPAIGVFGYCYERRRNCYVQKLNIAFEDFNFNRSGLTIGQNHLHPAILHFAPESTYAKPVLSKTVINIKGQEERVGIHTSVDNNLIEAPLLTVGVDVLGVLQPKHISCILLCEADLGASTLGC
ncbi:hypothetical protein FQA39_LY00037 [Lamprigera yunnana]|nr:hypothetical protein FQA39_LY00037 [Lamprigera yunnana]